MDKIYSLILASIKEDTANRVAFAKGQPCENKAFLEMVSYTLKTLNKELKWTT